MTRTKLAVAAALTTLLLAIPAFAQEAAPCSVQIVGEVDLTSSNEICRTDARLVNSCFTLPESIGSITVAEFIKEWSRITGSSEEQVYQILVLYNGWEGLDLCAIIPAGTSIRYA